MKKELHTAINILTFAINDYEQTIAGLKTENIALAALHEEGATTIEVITEENVKLRTKLAAFEQVIAHMTVPHHVV